MKWDFWFNKRRWERRMDIEFRFHLESLVDEYVKAGMTPKDARERAQREFGAVELAKDECRDERPAAWFEQFLGDIRYAMRGWMRNPGFAAAAILTVALGVGANTTIFSAVHAVLLKPLPYAEPGALYAVDAVIPERRAEYPSMPVPVQVYLEWRKSDTAFASLAALRPWECNLTGDAEPERAGGARVSANFFDVLGVKPSRGRWFASEEEQPGKDKVVVISDGLWKRRFGANLSVIGHRMDVNGESYEIIGVAPPELLVPTGKTLNPLLAFAPRVDVWTPIAPTPRELQSESWDHGLIARLKPGAEAERGRQQLQAIMNQYYRTLVPGLKTEFLTRAVPLRDVFSGQLGTRLLMVLGASGLLLLAACINLTNLLLARAASRRGEFAVRLALGASAARIRNQVIAETVSLAATGGAVGLLVALLGANWLATHGPSEGGLMAGASVNLVVLAFALALSLLTGLICGWLQARQALRADVSGGMQDVARAGTSRMLVDLRKVLVGVDVALAAMLLATAGLLLHSFVNVLGVDRGYDVERVLAVDLSLFGKRFNTGSNRAAFYRDVSARMRAMPGIEAAGAINDLPAAGNAGASRTIFHTTDTDFRAAVLIRPVAWIRGVTTGYFSASGTSLRAGRHFQENESGAVALISESLARNLWPGEKPSDVIGHRFRQGNVQGPLIEVTGVVEDVRSGAADRAAPLIIYRPYEQWASGPATLVVRSTQDPALVASAVRRSIRSLDNTIAIPAIRTMREIISESVAQRRFQLMMISLFASLALMIGAVGVYGVVSYAVARQTREIGVRMALGAKKRDILGWILATGMRPVALGLIAGLAGAVAIARVLSDQLFGVTPADTLTYVVVAGVLLTASALACYLPARRAAALDPLRALRHD